MTKGSAVEVRPREPGRGSGVVYMGVRLRALRYRSRAHADYGPGFRHEGGPPRFERVVGDSAGFAERFYHWLFTLAPATRAMFRGD